MTEQEWEDKLDEVQRHSENWYNKYKQAENQNRLLGERCTQLLNDKGNLTDQIADIKANCDLAIEGRDVKIKELAQQIEKMKKYTKCEGCSHQEEHLKALQEGKQGSAFCMLECNASHCCFELKGE